MWKPLYLGVGLKIIPPSHRGRWLCKTLDYSGPTYVKIGQFISNREDIFGPELANDLAPLRNRVSPFDFTLVKDQVPEDVTDVDPVPIASASIAQIHLATKNNKKIDETLL